MFLGVEIGGTKLQLGVGPGDGTLRGLWRGVVNAAAGGDGIRRQIAAAVPELLATAGLDRAALRGVGVGFGGPTDDATQSVIKSHHIAGWDGFPLAAWVTEQTGLPAVICNDADVAGLGEALFGAGQGLSPVFYMTVGSGIGGGLVINGEIYRGAGKGAAEIGHTWVNSRIDTSSTAPRRGMGREELETLASGWGIAGRAREELADEDGRWAHAKPSLLAAVPPDELTAVHVVDAARRGDAVAHFVMQEALVALAQALVQVIILLCPRRVVIGGGVSLAGDDVVFGPLRAMVRERVFPPFAGLTEIVPAALGEEVVVHGALALARRTFGG